ncbi:hypothetical protein Hanom_Chr06g00550061 [Helianthus anomalus]
MWIWMNLMWPAVYLKGKEDCEVGVSVGMVAVRRWWLETEMVVVVTVVVLMMV